MQQPFKRCILILADGARPDVMRDELNKGNLPHVSRHLVEKGVFEDIVSVFPSTTGPAYFPFLTGCHPGTLNVTGIRWFDRESYAKRGWSPKSFRSYVGLETFLINSDIPKSTQTVFNLYDKPFNILSGVYKGIKPQNNKTRHSRIWYYYYAHLTDRWNFIDKKMSDKLILSLDENPDFVFVVFPGIDETAHRTSPFSPRTRIAYHHLDTHVGELVKKLKEKNQYDDTLIAIVADHGLSETTKHFDIGPHLDTKGYKTLYYTNIFKRNVNASCMVSGNGMAHLYFKSDEGWHKRTSFEELSTKGLLLDELRLRPEVDLVAALGADGKIHLLTEKGHGYYSVKGEQVRYEWTNQEPLGLNLQTQGRNIDWTMDETYNQTFNSHFTDVFYQLHKLFQAPRTGDVIVSAKSGNDLRDKYEVPEHKASHGAICPQHMKIPLIMNYPITNKTAMRSMDVFPTILELTGKKFTQVIDGKSLV